MYRIITENGRTVKRFETERQAERYWDSMNGIITDDDGNEEHIYRGFKRVHGLYINRGNLVNKIESGRKNPLLLSIGTLNKHSM